MIAPKYPKGTLVIFSCGCSICYKVTKYLDKLGRDYVEQSIDDEIRRYLNSEGIFFVPVATNDFETFYSGQDVLVAIKNGEL